MIRKIPKRFSRRLWHSGAIARLPVYLNYLADKLESYQAEDPKQYGLAFNLDPEEIRQRPQTINNTGIAAGSRGGMPAGSPVALQCLRRGVRAADRQDSPGSRCSLKVCMTKPVHKQIGQVRWRNYQRTLEQTNQQVQQQVLGQVVRQIISWQVRRQLQEQR